MRSPAGIPFWGSEFDITTGKGYSVELNNVLSGAMGKIAHDLIVPAEIRSRIRHARTRFTCMHSGYSELKQVQDAINALAALPPVAAAATASAAAASKRSTTIKSKTRSAADDPTQGVGGRENGSARLCSGMRAAGQRWSGGPFGV